MISSYTIWFNLDQASAHMYMSFMCTFFQPLARPVFFAIRALVVNLIWAQPQRGIWSASYYYHLKISDLFFCWRAFKCEQPNRQAFQLSSGIVKLRKYFSDVAFISFFCTFASLNWKSWRCKAGQLTSWPTKTFVAHPWCCEQPCFDVTLAYALFKAGLGEGSRFSKKPLRQLFLCLEKVLWKLLLW